MSLDIITVVFSEDIPNLLYQAESLKKNWLGPKDWIIVCEDGRETRKVVIEEIVPRMQGWNVQVLMPPAIRGMGSGWWRQQVCKLWAVDVKSLHEHSLILDAKNFLIQPRSPDFFVSKLGITKVCIKTDLPHHPEWTKACEFFESSVDSNTECYALTPWVLSKKMVRKTIDEFQKRGHDIYNSKTGDLPAWEFYSYWVISQHYIKWEPAIFSYGILSAGDSEVAKQHIVAFSDTKMPFWTFHRIAASSPEVTKISNDFLKSQNVVDDNLIQKWTELSQKFNPNHT